MDDRTITSLLERVAKLEREAVRVRQGVVEDVGPLDVSVGGSAVSYVNVSAATSAGELEEGQTVALLTWGADLLVLGTYTSTPGDIQFDSIYATESLKTGLVRRLNGNLCISMTDDGGGLTRTFGNAGLSSRNASDTAGAPMLASAFTVDSDERVKSILAEGELKEALSVILQLRVVRFTYRLGEDSTERRGLIAQDVRRHRPELVISRAASTDEAAALGLPDDDGDLMSVDYQGLVADLVGAIQAQWAQIEKLTTRISELEEASP